MAGTKKAWGDYSPARTQACMRVLALLLSGIGEWRKSIVLVGGLTPEILVPKPAKVGPYIGTTDVDLVVDLAIMANPEAYSAFEDALTKLGFEPLEEEGQPSWKWRYTIDRLTKIVIEFLADDPDLAGGKIKPIPEHGRLAACNIRDASIVFDHYETEVITAELPGDRGVTKQEVRHADIVGFTVLKIFAFRNRAEGKDVHDLVYCLQNAEHSIAEIAARFLEALRGPRAEVIERALAELSACFGDEKELEGYLKDGPRMAALFEIGDRDEDRESRARRARDLAGVVNALLSEIVKLRS